MRPAAPAVVVAAERSGSPAPRPLLAALMAVLLLWPTLLNWHPYLFWDSYGYFLQGKAYLALLRGALGWGPVPPEAQAGWTGAAARMLADDASIRSPLYALPFHALAVLGSFWLVALVQAAAAAALVELALARIFGLAAGRRLVAWAGLLVLSSLPWFASFLMPDLWAGLLILATVLIALGWRRLRWPERLFALLVELAAITVHGSHLPLALGVAAAAVVLAPAPRLGAGLRLLLPLALAIGLGSAANHVLFGGHGPTPPGPPFLLARSWEDGPVKAYLAARCGVEDWALCGLRDRLEPTAQEFLWGKANSFWAMDPALRSRVRREEADLVRRAVLAQPLAQAAAAGRHTLEQLGRIGLGDFVLGRGAVVTPADYTFLYLPEAPAAKAGLGTPQRLVVAGTVLGALLIAWALMGRERAGGGLPTGGLRRLVLVVAAGLLLNAAICGALSGPADRYQARVAWLVPLLGLGLALRPKRERLVAVSRARAGTAGAWT